MNSILRLAILAATTLAIAACDSSDPVIASGSDGNNAPGTAATAEKDWTTVVSETPEGGFRMGNPDARVQLVEFGSFTCSHCKDFHADSVEHLQPEYVRNGQLSYEFRPFMLNIYDFAATELAMCQGAGKFFRWANELFHNQEGWVEPFTKLKETDIAALQSLPLGAQVLGLAKAGELDRFAAKRGIPGKQFDECLGNETAIDTLARQQQKSIDSYKIEGTPTFLLNGKKVENTTTWEQLKPQIVKALG